MANYLPGNQLLPNQQLQDLNRQLQSINQEVGNIERHRNWQEQNTLMFSNRIEKIIISDNTKKQDYEDPECLKVFVGSNGTLPTRGSEFSAGWDLYSSENIMLCHGTRKLIDTDIIVSIPKGYYGRIAPRSGLALKNGINVLAGVLDSDFRGMVKVLLFNHGEDITILKGDRIAQLIITVYNRRPLIQVNSKEELGTTERGTGGFGSTGH